MSGNTQQGTIITAPQALTCTVKHRRTQSKQHSMPRQVRRKHRQRTIKTVSYAVGDHKTPTGHSHRTLMHRKIRNHRQSSLKTLAYASNSQKQRQGTVTTVVSAPRVRKHRQGTVVPVFHASERPNTATGHGNHCILSIAEAENAGWARHTAY